MSWRSMVAAGVLAMGVATAAVPASAGLLYDNMFQQSNPALPYVTLGTSGPLGAQFTTDAFTAGISGIQVLLKGDNESTGSFIVTIVNDAGNTPDLVNPALFTSSPVVDNTLTAAGDYLIWDSGIMFQPVATSTSYWVMLTDSTGSTIDWTYADTDSSGVPGNLASLYNYFDGGAVQNDDWPFVMQVQCVGLAEGPCGSSISEVPEPATIGLLGAGMVALGVAVRRRRKMAA